MGEERERRTLYIVRLDKTTIPRNLEDEGTARLRAPTDRILVEHDPIPITTLLARITRAIHNVALALILGLNVPKLITAIALCTIFNTSVSVTFGGTSTDASVGRVAVTEVGSIITEEASAGIIDEAADLFESGRTGCRWGFGVDGQEPSATANFFAVTGAGGGARSVRGFLVGRERIATEALVSGFESGVLELLSVASSLATLDGLRAGLGVGASESTRRSIVVAALVGPAVSLAGVVGVSGRSGSAATGGRGGAILLVNAQQPSTTARLRRVASARCRASRVGRLFNSTTADRVGAIALVTGFHTSELVSLSIARVDATVGGEGGGRGRGAAEGSCPRIRVAAGG
jgi:hypothetical protein